MISSVNIYDIRHDGPSSEAWFVFRSGDFGRSKLFKSYKLAQAALAEHLSGAEEMVFYTWRG